MTCFNKLYRLKVEFSAWFSLLIERSHGVKKGKPGYQ